MNNELNNIYETNVQIDELKAQEQIYREYLQHLNTLRQSLEQKNIQSLLNMEECIWIKKRQDPSLLPWKEWLHADGIKSAPKELRQQVTIGTASLIGSNGYHIHTEQHSIHISPTDNHSWNQRLYPYIEEIFEHLKDRSLDNQHINPSVQLRIHEVDIKILRFKDHTWCATNRHDYNKYIHLPEHEFSKKARCTLYHTLDELFLDQLDDFYKENKKTHLSLLQSESTKIIEMYKTLIDPESPIPAMNI